MCDHNPIEYRDANTGELLYRSRSQPPPCDCGMSERKARAVGVLVMTARLAGMAPVNGTFDALGALDAIAELLKR